MAELTHLDEKLAEVLGLAQAAQTATKKVASLARQEKDTELLELLRRMGDEAAKVEQRCDDAPGTREGMKTAIAAKARETKAEVTGFMKTYLEDAEASTDWNSSVWPRPASWRTGKSSPRSTRPPTTRTSLRS
jgi:hypothetical protein